MDARGKSHGGVLASEQTVQVDEVSRGVEVLMCPMDPPAGIFTGVRMRCVDVVMFTHKPAHHWPHARVWFRVLRDGHVIGVECFDEELPEVVERVVYGPAPKVGLW